MRVQFRTKVAEWVHFLDGYRKVLIEFDMKKFGDDWQTAEAF